MKCYSVSRDGALFLWECNRNLEEFEVDDSKRKHKDEIKTEEGCPFMCICVSILE